MNVYPTNPSSELSAAVNDIRREITQGTVVEDLRGAVEAEALLRMRCFLHELKDLVEAAGGSPAELRTSLVKAISERIDHLRVLTSGRRSLWNDDPTLRRLKDR